MTPTALPPQPSEPVHRIPDPPPKPTIRGRRGGGGRQNPAENPRCMREGVEASRVWFFDEHGKLVNEPAEGVALGFSRTSLGLRCAGTGPRSPAGGRGQMHVSVPPTLAGASSAGTSRATEARLPTIRKGRASQLTVAACFGKSRSTSSRSSFLSHRSSFSVVRAYS